MRKALPIVGIFFLILWVSCSRADRVPGDLMDPVKMSGILLDMRMASAYNDTYVPDTGSTPMSRELRIKTLYAQVLELHHTDHERFMESYTFYEDHPDLMQKIYTIMQDSIDRKSAYQNAIIEKADRLRMQRMRPYQPIRVKDYLMMYRLAADSFPEQPLRIFRPEGRQPPVPVMKPKDFMWLYKSIADSVHYQPRRILDPDLFN